MCWPSISTPRSGSRTSCGTRGCGYAGIQLRKQVPAGDLPALVALLRALPKISFDR